MTHRIALLRREGLLLWCVTGYLLAALVSVHRCAAEGEALVDSISRSEDISRSVSYATSGVRPDAPVRWPLYGSHRKLNAQAAVCREGCTRHSDMDWGVKGRQYHWFVAQSPRDCCDACSGDAHCAAYVFYKGHCYLKAASARGSGYTPLQGATSGEKRTGVNTGGNGGGDNGIASYICPSKFQEMFKHSSDSACSPGFYTYQAFIAAAASFPDFGTSRDDETNKREIAAFLGQISHETTGGWPTAPDGPYAWGLCFKEEINKADYCDPSQFPCAKGQQYYGRGPVQLSWNYNYIPAGWALGFDGLNDPGAVSRDSTLAFKTAIWFWMRPAGDKPSCHAVMTGDWSPSPADRAAGRKPGYGTVTNIINGGLECDGGNPAAEADRIGFFKRYAGLLGVSVGDNLSCANQTSF